MDSALLLTGIGLRAAHYAEFLAQSPKVAWVEVHPENFFAEGGKAITTLEQVRRNYPVSLHGVNLSLGSTDDLNWQHLKKLKDLCDRINPCLISEHLAWSSWQGQYFNDLFPLPYTEDSLAHLVGRIQQVQDYLGRQLLIENISAYVTYTESNMPENFFLETLAERSGCGILLDVNNVYVTETNMKRAPEKYIEGLSSKHIQEIHLGGFSSRIIAEEEVLVDTHNKPIVAAVWDLFQLTVKKLGMKPTMIEWDADLPSLATLCMEAYRAEQILRKHYVPTKHAS